jgi:phage terminase large subunit-like protein
VIDDITKLWIRNAADERAAANGCRFSIARGAYTVWWIERYCRLYEGEWAGAPLVLRGAYSQPMEPILDEWDDGGKEKSVQRARDYMDAVSGGEPCDWQYECTIRFFGWEAHSKRWERWVRRFHKAGIWVAKKNKKSPTLAAWAMYALAGDNEQGQKVFLAAKDGNQVRKNVALHILAMIEQSPELRESCKINLNEMSVAYPQTRSLLLPMSSSNSRTQEAKEGLNGSVFVDETHVVDREFIKRINRAGISRSEPIFAQFSTAGKDPDAYGKEEFDRGLAVNEGRENIQDYFCACYAAPQVLSDEQVAEDTITFGRMANPAWGHTIDEAEYLTDYETSKRSIADMADFKMYRLNIWQRAANPWLRADHWLKCGRIFAADDMLGKPCGAGLDLGQTDDMTSLSLVFPENASEWGDVTGEVTANRKQESGGELDAAIAGDLLKRLDQPVRVLTWYWLPEGAVQKYAHLAPYQEWVKAGLLKTTPGDTLDPKVILDDLRGIFKRYDVQMFAHDPWHAALLVEALKGNDGFPADCCWQFSQTIKFYAFPSVLFERLVIAGKLHHDGNPITAWQAGHVTAKVDNNGNVRPVKPPRGDRKKIDGIVATIMGLDAATRLVCKTSIYETREMAFL